MTVASELSRVAYLTDGATTTFSVPFRFLQAAHLRVIHAHGQTQSELPASGYSVTGAGNPAGGAVHITPALAAGGQLVIVRQVPITQETAYPKNDPFPEAAHEAALDKLTMIAQQIQDETRRAIKLSVVAPMTGDAFVASLYGVQTAAAASAIQAANSAATANTRKNQAANSATQAANSAALAAASATEAANNAAASTANTALATANAATVTANAAAANATAAQTAVASLLAWPLLIKADYTQPCLEKTSASTLRVRAGTALMVNGGLVSFNANKAVVMPALSGGKDYSVWVTPDGTAQAVLDPFDNPASAPVAGARKIGGFHVGLVATNATHANGGFATTTGTGAAAGGMIWTQAHVNAIAGINQYSLWDLTFRSAGEQHGFVFDPQTRVWVAIYLCGKFHDADGISAYSKTVASGTVLPRIPAAYRNGTSAQTYDRLDGVVATEIAASHGARLPRAAEFFSAAWGVTEGQSLGGAEATIALTKREPGYTSRIGLEQATGHLWVWGDTPANFGDGSWYVVPGGRGCAVGALAMSRFGGVRTAGGYSGSRSNYGRNGYGHSDWTTGLRAVCDHYQALR